MYERNKDTKTFNITGVISFKWLFFDSIAKSLISNPTKSLWWNFLAKIVNEFLLLTFFAKKTPT